MTQTSTVAAQSTSSTRALTPRRPGDLPSRSHPPAYRVSTPRSLRYAQVALLLAGLLVGLAAIPLMLTSGAYALQSTAEDAHRDLSTIQTELAKANEIALTAMVSEEPDRTAFQEQMGVVAQSVARAGQSSDSEVLGSVNAGLIAYTADVNTALTSQATAQGSGISDMQKAQDAHADVTADLRTLLDTAASWDISATVAVAAAWAALGVGAGVALWTGAVIARRTRRVINLGLLGSVAMLALGAVAVGVLGGMAGESSRATAVHTLTTAEGHLATARAGELSYLLDPTPETKNAVDAQLTQAQELLDEHGVTDALTQYERGWSDVVSSMAAGDEATAIQTATTENAEHLAAANREIATIVNEDRLASESTLSAGTRGLLWLGVSMIVVALGYLILAIGGVQVRTREYR